MTNRSQPSRLARVSRSHLLPLVIFLSSWTIGQIAAVGTAHAQALKAGAAKVDITQREGTHVHDTLYAKALVIQSESTTAVIITVDAVAIDRIGSIGSDFLPNVRSTLERELGIPPHSVMINASHCHGIVCQDIEARTVQAVRAAWNNREPVRIGVGVGHEDRIMENRRLRLKNGRETDVRHAYAMPKDAEVAAIGPIDPEIGILRLDRTSGDTLALVYNFAVHPIQGVPSGGNTADIIGYASQVIEDNLSEGTVALFLQGCAGDINPVMYKDVAHPRDAEPLGNMLGLSTLKAARRIKPTNDRRFQVVHQKLELPRADFAPRIEALLSEQERLLQSLQGTTLNLKTYLPLAVRYSLSPDFPSFYSHRYLLDKAQGREFYARLDADNRRSLVQYEKNIEIMEELTRLRTNLALLRKHQAENAAAKSRMLEVEINGLRLGDFVLVTFPGELTVQIGLNIKSGSPHPMTFVSGYTNGYIYYAATEQQLRNGGWAQEDCDCLLDPEWQTLFEQQVFQVLRDL
jgi:hypothetical protein